MKGPREGLAAAGVALVVTMGCGHAGASPAREPAAHAAAGPTTAARASVPLPLKPIPGSSGVQALVDVSVGGGPTVPVLLDTGSSGLFMLPEAIGPHAAPVAGTRYDERYVGGALVTEATRAVVSLGGSPRATTAGPIAIGSVVTSATDTRYLRALFGSIDAKGIMGMALSSPNPAPPFLSPLVQLPPPLSEGYALRLPAQGGGAGELVLGRPVRSSTTVAIPLVSAAGAYQNGLRAYQKDVQLCWTVGGATGCGITNLDTGFSHAALTADALPGAPRAGRAVPPGTTVTVSSPSGSRLYSFSVARTPVDRALLYTPLFPPTQFNTGIGFYFSNVVGWDLEAGQLLVTPQRG